MAALQASTTAQQSCLPNRHAEVRPLEQTTVLTSSERLREEAEVLIFTPSSFQIWKIAQIVISFSGKFWRIQFPTAIIWSSLEDSRNSDKNSVKISANNPFLEEIMQTFAKFQIRKFY